jgi:adenine deaminase
MSIETFIRAMPKVELNTQLEGAIPRETLMLIADDNNIISTMKPRQWNEITGYLQKPDMTKLDDISRSLAAWLKYPEDLTRVVYDLGVSFYHQKVVYAEVSVSPTLYVDAGMTFEQVMDALNDGRDRVERAWKIRMNWILTIPRANPRRGDDVSRWVTSAAGRKGNVIGIGIDGREDTNAVGQFAKSFATVEKKGLGRVAPAHTYSHTESIKDVVETLNPSRITDSWNLSEDAEALNLLAERELPLIITPTRELRMGRINAYTDYPIRPLLDNVRLILSGGMSELYKTTLTDEYLAVAKHHNLLPDEVAGLAMNAIQYSFLSDDDKQSLVDHFNGAYEQLRVEHLADV